MQKMMKLSLIYLVIFSFQFDRAKLMDNDPNNQEENSTIKPKEERGKNSLRLSI